jgi:hypothetical protein
MTSSRSTASRVISWLRIEDRPSGVSNRLRIAA